MTKPKKIIVSVTTDLVSDQRVHKVCSSLHSAGYEVLLVGRVLTENQVSKRSYKTKRFRLLFKKGFLFYANYNLKLFFFLLFKKVDVLLSNDLDTLLANFLAAKLKGLPLVYDSHEYFTEVPELVSRPKVKQVWERLEGIILPRLEYCYTVTEHIADLYNRKYKLNFKPVRNFPILLQEETMVKRESVILYQGALNVGRGIEELIEAMSFVNKGKLWIVGEGDISSQLKNKVQTIGLEDKVEFWGKIPFEKLRAITQRAKIGVSLEKKEGLNYTYALPNKVFDYIHAGVPVLYADLQEVKKTLKDFKVGEELISYGPKVMADQLNRMLEVTGPYDEWVEECKRAAKELNWQKEQEVLLAIFEKLR